MTAISVPALEDAGIDTTSACEIRCLAPADGAPDDVEDSCLFDGPALRAERLSAVAGIVLLRGGAARAIELLAAGARRVLLGEAALVDASVVATLAATFGRERVGVYVPARRFEVRWSFDATTNADFKVLTPSLGAPAWEALRADGTGTGTEASRWIGAMLEVGASEALLCVDIRDDADLNLCADCVERFGPRIWIGPLADPAPALDEWILHGRARRLVLPPALHARAVVGARQMPGAAEANAGPAERAA